MKGVSMGLPNIKRSTFDTIILDGFNVLDMF